MVATEILSKRHRQIVTNFGDRLWTPAEMTALRVWITPEQPRCAGGVGRQYTRSNSEFHSRASEATFVVTGTQEFWLFCAVYLDTSAANAACISKFDFLAPDREYLLQFANVSQKFTFTVSNDGIGSTVVEDDALGANVILDRFYFMFAWTESGRIYIRSDARDDLGSITSAVHTTGVNAGNSSFRIGATGPTTTNFMDGRIAMPCMGKPPTPLGDGSAGTLAATIASRLFNSGNGLRFEELSSSERIAFGLTPGDGWFGRSSEASGALTDAVAGLDLADNATVTTANGPAALNAKDSTRNRGHGHLFGFDAINDWKTDIAPGINNIDGGYSLDFDAIGTHILVDDGDAYSFGIEVQDLPFSLGSWVKPDAVDSRTIIAKGTSAAREYEFQFSGGKIRLILYDDTQANNIVATSQKVFTAQIGTWFHIAATYDGSGLASGITLYDNGVAISDTDSTGGTYVAMHNQTGRLVLGRNQTDGAFFFDGKINDPRIYGEQLSAAQMLQWATGTDPTGLEGSFSNVNTRTRLFTTSGGDDWLGRPRLLDRGDGTWIVIYRSAARHVSSPSPFHIRFSDDEGRTWSKEDKTIAGASVVGAPITAQIGTGIGDASLMTAPNGDFLFCGSEIGTGITSQWRSTDGGLSWFFEGSIVGAGPAKLTGQGVIVGSTLYLSGFQGTDPNQNSELWKTDDNGSNWSFLIDITDVADNTDETGIVSLGDGEFLCVIRADQSVSKTFTRKLTGNGTIRGPLVDATAFLGVLQRPMLKTFSDEPGRIYLFGRDASGGSNADRIVGYFTEDDGVTWSGRKYIDATAYVDAGYTDVIKRDDGTYYMISFDGTQDVAGVGQWVFSLEDETGRWKFDDPPHSLGVSDGDLVQSIEGRSDNRVLMTQVDRSKQPVLIENSSNSQPGLRADGVNDLLTVAAADLPSDLLTDVVGNISLAFRTDAAVAGGTIWSVSDEATSGESFEIEINSTTKKLRIRHIDGGVKNEVEGTTVLVADRTYYLVITCDGVAWTMRLVSVDEPLSVITGSNTGAFVGQLTGVDNMALLGLKNTSELNQSDVDLLDAFISGDVNNGNIANSEDYLAKFV